MQSACGALPWQSNPPLPGAPLNLLKALEKLLREAFHLDPEWVCVECGEDITEPPHHVFKPCPHKSKRVRSRE